MKGWERSRIKNIRGWNVKGTREARNVTVGLAGLGREGVSVRRKSG